LNKCHPQWGADLGIAHGPCGHFKSSTHSANPFGKDKVKVSVPVRLLQGRDTEPGILLRERHFL